MHTSKVRQLQPANQVKPQDSRSTKNRMPGFRRDPMSGAYIATTASTRLLEKQAKIQEVSLTEVLFRLEAVEAQLKLLTPKPPLEDKPNGQL